MAKRLTDCEVLTYLPEVPVDEGRMLADIEKGYAKGKGLLVTVSEGICGPDGKPLADTGIVFHVGHLRQRDQSHAAAVFRRPDSLDGNHVSALVPQGGVHSVPPHGVGLRPVHGGHIGDAGPAQKPRLLRPGLETHYALPLMGGDFPEYALLRK